MRPNTPGAIESSPVSDNASLCEPAERWRKGRNPPLPIPCAVLHSDAQRRFVWRRMSVSAAANGLPVRASPIMSRCMSLIMADFVAEVR